MGYSSSPPLQVQKRQRHQSGPNSPHHTPISQYLICPITPTTQQRRRIPRTAQCLPEPGQCARITESAERPDPRRHHLQTVANRNAPATPIANNYADIRGRTEHDKHAKAITPTINSHVCVAAAVYIPHSAAADCSADRVDSVSTTATTATNQIAECSSIIRALVFNATTLIISGNTNCPRLKKTRADFEPKPQAQRDQCRRDIAHTLKLYTSAHTTSGNANYPRYQTTPADSEFKP